MMAREIFVQGACAVVLGCVLADVSRAADGPEGAPSTVKATATKTVGKEKPQKSTNWKEVIRGSKKVEGLFPLYYNEKEQKLLMEIGPDKLGRELILPISIARGAGWLYLGGQMLNFGNQWIVSFRRSADRIHLVRHNVRYRANGHKPQADAVRTSYTDSVVKALPIKSEKGGKVLVDLADLFMTDLAGIGIKPDRRRSRWTKVKGFPRNVEFEVSNVFNMNVPREYYYFGLDLGIPDPRGTQVVMHYGLSLLPTDSAYKPRPADDRVGTFLSVVKDFSTDNEKSPFVRNVARWKLKKEFPDQELSPPKDPIIFWVEKSVPREYRKYVRAGILEWNKAFEKVGFIDAIQVRDQLSRDDFDAEDIRYNTFRWIATSMPFAMGPSRFNPKTGEILDADILFDEAMVRYQKQYYLRRVGLLESMAMLRNGYQQAWFKLHAAGIPEMVEMESAIRAFVDEQGRQHRLEHREDDHPQQIKLHGVTPFGMQYQCQYGAGIQRQLGLVAAVLHAEGKIDSEDKVPKAFVGQAIKEITMHEVGHTLGLRHNFKGSAMLKLADCNKPEVTAKRGMSGSIMDYLPANLAAPGEKQGDYFSPTIGPYDYWAIEYAYKPIIANEVEELKKIASRIAEPGLDFGTDEDLWLSPDPRINAYDLGDPLEFAVHRTKLVKKRLDDLADRMVAKGEGWQRAREAVSVLLGELASSTYLAAQYVGAEYSYRDHRGDPNGRTPLELIPIEKQREAMQFLTDHILSDKAFKFSPELLKRLPPEYWTHWGTYSGWWSPSYQYDVNRRLFGIQRIVLNRLLNDQVLRSLQNIELQAEENEEVLKMPEVFDVLTAAIWGELPAASESVEEKIDISAMRRNLQREHIGRLSGIVLGSRPGWGRFVSLFDPMVNAQFPADARALARLQLRAIDTRIGTVIEANKANVSDYSRAHLEELHDQIGKVLSASLEASPP